MKYLKLFEDFSDEEDDELYTEIHDTLKSCKEKLAKGTFRVCYNFKEGGDDHGGETWSREWEVFFLSMWYSENHNVKDRLKNGGHKMTTHELEFVIIDVIEKLEHETFEDIDHFYDKFMDKKAYEDGYIKKDGSYGYSNNTKLYFITVEDLNRFKVLALQEYPQYAHILEEEFTPEKRVKNYILNESLDFEDDDEDEEEDEVSIKIDEFVDNLINNKKYGFFNTDYVISDVADPKNEEIQYIITAYDLSDAILFKDEYYTNFEDYISKLGKLRYSLFNYKENNVSIFNYRLSKDDVAHVYASRLTQAFLDYRTDLRNKMNILYIKPNSMLICDENMDVLDSTNYFFDNHKGYLIYYEETIREKFCRYIVIDPIVPEIVIKTKELPYLSNIGKVFTMIQKEMK